MSSPTVNVRSEAIAKRKVYKSALDSPFVIKWPMTDEPLGRSILDNLCQILSPIASYKRDPKTNQRPAILDRLHCGLRATTKFLEKRIKESQLSTTDSSFAAIFVCRREIQPPHLCEHLLRMACLARVKVVSLPQGSEPKLAASCGLKTLSAVGMVVGEGEGILRDDLEKINDVQAPWLSAASYKPTKVKVIETTAPLTKPNKRKADNPPQEPPSKKAK